MSSELKFDESTLRGVVEDVLRSLGQTSSTAVPSKPEADCACAATPLSVSVDQGKHGVFQTAGEAAQAASVAFSELRKLGVAGRDKVVNIVKTMTYDKAEEWGKLELAETKIGRLDHKIAKLLGLRNVPGTEWLSPYGMSGDHGISMEEYTPFGVIGAITPVTHSIPTLSGNIINMVAAGNTLVINAHPNGARCAAVAVREFNQAIEREIGIPNIVTIVETPSLDSFNELCGSEDVNLLCVTGGPGVVNAAMKSGKRSICAGPGNPPVLVDETANLDKAAEGIIFGGSFDNNLLCIGEKEIFVVDTIYNKFIEALKKAGAAQLNSSQLDRLTQAAFTDSKDAGGCSHPVLNRDLVGRDPSVLADIAGASIAAGTELLFAETDADHPFVFEEQMMPMVPVVRVKDVQEGIERSLVAEHGYKHSAMIHSLNVENMTKMLQALDCTLFVKNGACLAGLGTGGEGYSSFSIATTTGEGITTPKTFTRTRRCVLVDSLRSF